ncbi:MAG: endolytic transglycosylase MltG [Patescibacteria group bacterium]
MLKKLILLPLLATLIVALGIFWFYSNTKAPSNDSKFSDFLITKGTSAMQVGNNLYKAGLIKSPLAYKIYIQFTGKSGKIPAGEFRIASNMNLFQVVESLLKGPIELWVTVPEGLRREEIAAKFTAGLDRDQTFTDEFLVASKGKEGTLFPDTYLFPKDASASAIVAKMTSTFKSKTASLDSSGSPLSFQEKLILASIIERETKKDEERPIVAGVLMNRLNIGMALQVDAAVQYAVGTPKNWWPILTRDDLTSVSKFNTYKYAGLPPSPIANPGISSIKAAYAPKDSDYWYYIHDPKGLIHYAKTLSEHNANVSKYLEK